MKELYHILCKNGHYFTYEIGDPRYDPFNWKCSICNGELAWENIADKVELKIKIKEKISRCSKCGHVNVISPSIYEIPVVRVIKKKSRTKK